MNDIEQWNGDIKNLPNDYLGQVLKFANQNGVTGIRFGITGKGIRPNYQLILLNDSPQPMNGQNHKKFRDTAEFIESNVTETFTKEQLSAAFFGG